MFRCVVNLDVLDKFGCHGAQLTSNTVYVLNMVPDRSFLYKRPKVAEMPRYLKY